MKKIFNKQSTGEGANMSMSKKDFIALADVIKEANERGKTFTYDHLGILAGFCASVNPRFMPTRWLNYIEGKCGKNGGENKAQKSFGRSSFKPFTPAAA
jgi:hypothetical protein